MTNFTRLTAAPLLSLMLFGSIDSMAVNHSGGFDIHNYALKLRQSRQQKGLSLDKALPETRAEVKEGFFKAASQDFAQPDASLPASYMIGDLDAPDGSLWYYTGNFKYDYVEVSEYYKRPIMREFEFTIYDDEMNLVGTIKDKVTYKEGETAVPLADLAPFITRHYFNSDDKYEVVVGMYVNTEIYVNNEYSYVYSIGGEKEDGYDKPILVRTDTIGDVLNASTDEEENFYITFMRNDDLEVTEKDPDNPDPNDPDFMGFWEMLTSYGMKLETYAKADADGNLVKVWEKRIRLADLPGDQESSAFLISFVKDGKPYYLYSQYEDTFFTPYYNFIDETTMRENNHLVLELYSIENNAATLEHQTKIPMVLNNEEDDMVLCSYYSVGSLRYRDDVIFPEGKNEPEYYITVQDYSKENEDNNLMSFYTYNADGTLKNTLFKSVLAHSTLADLPGFDPSEVFITYNVMGEYVFHIVNLATAKEELTFTNYYEIDEYSDPEMLTSNMDRVPVGDTFKYAMELRSPGQDENGDDLMRILWMDRNGKFDRIDEVPMGNGVYYATVLIESKSLNPNLYDPDDEYEYLILVKRGYEGNVVKEELLVAKPLSQAYPDGKVILYLKPDEERGDLRTIAPLTYSDDPVLLISYYKEKEGEGRFSEDFYKLPFTTLNAGVENIPASGVANSAIEFDGATLTASGKISLFNIQGALVGEAIGRMDVTELPGGIYVAHANGSTLKIFVK